MIHQNSLRFYKDWAVDENYNGLVLTESAGEAALSAVRPRCWVHIVLGCGAASSLLPSLAKACHGGPPEAPVMIGTGMSAAWL